MEITSQNPLQLIITRQQHFLRLASNSPMLKSAKKDIKRHIVRGRFLSSMRLANVQYKQSNHRYSQQGQGHVSSLQVWQPLGQSEEVRSLLHTKPGLILHLPQLQKELWSMFSECKSEYLSCLEPAKLFQQLYHDVDLFVKEVQQAKSYWISLIETDQSFSNKILRQVSVNDEIQQLQQQFQQVRHFVYAVNELKNLKDNHRIDRLEAILSTRLTNLLDKIQRNQFTDQTFHLYFTQYIYTAKFLIINYDNQRELFLRGSINREQKFYEAIDIFFNKRQVRKSDVYYCQDYMHQILELFIRNFHPRQVNGRYGNQLVDIQRRLQQSPKYLHLTSHIQVIGMLKQSLQSNVYEEFIDRLFKRDPVCCNEYKFFGKKRINNSTFIILKQVSTIYSLFESPHLREIIRQFYCRHIGQIKQVISGLSLSLKTDSHFFKIPFLKMLSKRLTSEVRQNKHYIDGRQIEGLINCIEDKLLQIRDTIRNNLTLFDGEYQYFIVQQILGKSDIKFIPNFDEDANFEQTLRFAEFTLNQDPFENTHQPRTN